MNSLIPLSTRTSKRQNFEQINPDFANLENNNFNIPADNKSAYNNNLLNVINNQFQETNDPYKNIINNGNGNNNDSLSKLIDDIHLDMISQIPNNNNNNSNNNNINMIPPNVEKNNVVIKSSNIGLYYTGLASLLLFILLMLPIIKTLNKYIGEDKQYISIIIFCIIFAILFYAFSKLLIK